MSTIGGFTSAIVRGFNALPFVLRRLIIVMMCSAIWLAGCFMYKAGASDLAMLFLFGGAIGALWASGTWRIFRLVLLLVLIFAGD
ncbi:MULTISPECIES: hypothetical protein [Burkholderia]|uniref:hypothetical protein n=1 Tax=Burkholderia TaxID=32008 RepID=UPI000759FC26|nr:MULTISPECIES: hypothetical protein [Burkholderia]AOJ73362.1 hypothetical protein WS78_31265 [Burkholderia savannae]KVG41187.1 hypothetical protein WS77_17345 [Burkholderia sp. MSMB0265]KVG81090.1 hypothetical protein WS81_12000 [Burkholderia sp. MSMB2040]KVG95478.1 hypothetical protein WS82_05430 [Burkholderia sp. MSMB2041]KVG96830.1 hypothetical protein WS83_01940 [Burkholderia sp. MSMB2042]